MICSRLAVAQRPQHDQHDGTDGRQAGRVDGGNDCERTDECEVGHSRVHRRYQASEEREALRGGFVVVDQIDDAFGGLWLHVEHVHLHAELRGLAERCCEFHAGCRRAAGLSLDGCAKRTRVSRSGGVRCG